MNQYILLMIFYLSKNVQLIFLLSHVIATALLTLLNKASFTFYIRETFIAW